MKNPIFFQKTENRRFSLGFSLETHRSAAPQQWRTRCAKPPQDGSPLRMCPLSSSALPRALKEMGALRHDHHVVVKHLRDEQTGTAVAAFWEVGPDGGHVPRPISINCCESEIFFGVVSCRFAPILVDRQERPGV